MGANGWVGLFTVTGGHGEAERVGGVNVTLGFFPTLGVQPALGRLFTADEDRPGGPSTAILSDGIWRRRYGADPAIIGRSITINARPVTVVGVLPASYRHLEINPERPAEIFAPYQFDPAQANRGGHFIRGVGRLKESVSVEQARAEMDGHRRAARAAVPRRQHRSGRGRDAAARIDGRRARGRSCCCFRSGGLRPARRLRERRQPVAGSRTGRLRELALRAAIGADRARLVRQMLTESAALSLVGAAGGLLLAYWATRTLTVLASAGVPRAEQIGIDLPVLVFTLTCALLTSVGFGLMPAVHLSRQDLHESLKEGGRQLGPGIGRGARELLIVAEVALSIVLLIGAGLLVRSLWQLQQVDPGFAAENVLAMEVSLPTARYEEGEQMPFYQRLEQRIRSVAGVAEVGAINILPLSNNYDSRGIQVEDRPMPEGQGPAPQARSITPGYFRAMRIPLIAGREFDAHDIEGRQRVVIISRTMADKYWPGEDALGKRDHVQQRDSA